MKKMLVSLFLGALAMAPALDAAILGVRNRTGKPITVVVIGSDNNFNSLNATKVAPGAEGIFGGTPNISGPMRFAFVEDLSKAKYNIFETYMGNGNDPEFAKLKTQAEKDQFMREKATGYGRGYNNQTFTVWGLEAKYVTVSLSEDKYYTDANGTRQKLPIVMQTYPQDAWWQNRPWQPMKVKTVKAATPESGDQAEW